MKLIDDLIDRADEVQRRQPALAFPVAVWKKFADDQAGNLAALIAYYTFVAIFPLLLVLITVLDIVLRHNAALRQNLINSALSAYPVIGPQIKNNVNPLHSTGIALAVGIIGALLGARGIAMAMQNALNSVWAVPQERRPAFPWSILRGVGGIGHLLTGAPAEAGTIALAFVLNIGVFWVAFRLATAA